MSSNLPPTSSTPVNPEHQGASIQLYSPFSCSEVELRTLPLLQPPLRTGGRKHTLGVTGHNHNNKAHKEQNFAPINGPAVGYSTVKSQGLTANRFVIVENTAGIALKLAFLTKQSLYFSLFGHTGSPTVGRVASFLNKCLKCTT